MDRHKSVDDMKREVAAMREKVAADAEAQAVRRAAKAAKLKRIQRETALNTLAELAERYRTRSMQFRFNVLAELQREFEEQQRSIWAQRRLRHMARRMRMSAIVYMLLERQLLEARSMELWLGCEAKCPAGRGVVVGVRRERSPFGEYLIRLDSAPDAPPTLVPASQVVPVQSVASSKLSLLKQNLRSGVLTLRRSGDAGGAAFVADFDAKNRAALRRLREEQRARLMRRYALGAFRVLRLAEIRRLRRSRAITAAGPYAWPRRAFHEWARVSDHLEHKRIEVAWATVADWEQERDKWEERLGTVRQQRAQLALVFNKRREELQVQDSEAVEQLRESVVRERRTVAHFREQAERWAATLQRKQDGYHGQWVGEVLAAEKEREIPDLRTRVTRKPFLWSVESDL